MGRSVSLAILLLCSCALASPPAVSFLAGGEADTEKQSYSYAGLVLSRTLKAETYALFKVWGDYLTYRFPHGNTTIRADAPAFQLSAGLGRDYGPWSLTLWSGWERRDTRVKPDTENVEVRGVRDSLVLQFEAYGGFRNGARISFITSYSSGTSYLWSRARLKKALGDRRVSLGLEILGHGNEDYRAFQSGLLLEIQIAKAYVLLKGGSKNSSQGNSLYGGAELYLGF